MNKKKKAKRIRNLSILGAIIIIILIGMIYGCRKYTIKPVDNSIDTDEMQFSQFRDDESRLDNSLLSYGKVLNKYMDKKYEDYTGPDIEINANDYISTSGDPIRPFTEDYKPEDSDYTIKADPNAIIFTGDKLTTVTYEIVVPESKLYNLQFDYALFEGKNSDMQVGITIDGKKPFDEANNLNLKRCYEFYDSQEYDSQGNQIRPKQREVFKWQTKIASNPDGIYKNVYKMFLNKTPENKTTVIELTFSREPGAVSKISFIAPVKNISYDEYRNLPEIKDAPVYSGEILPPIQMEDPISKTDLGMRAESDSDYLSKPPSYDKMMYNVFGGDRWKYGGQSATWEFEVKESGWYEIVTRYSIQSDSITTYREISINGEIPFEDMEEYAFTNVSGWVGDPIKNLNGDPYLFYLHEGMNTITMTSKLGPIRNAIQSLTDLNDAVNDFLKILQQITASARDTAGNISVDKNMDWDLDKYIEDLPERLSSYTNVLNEQYDYIRTANGGKIPSYASSIAAAADLFKKLEKDHNIIPSQMNNILTSLNGISTSIVSMKEQPMSFDYMLIAPPNADYGNVRSNPFQSLLVGVKQFYFSFVKDYTAVGMPTVDKNVPEIYIWVARGREWIEILRDKINEEFTPDNNVRVKLNTIPGSTDYLLLLSYTAGKAPDGALAVGGTTPVDFAVRDAVVPLSDLEGFDELKAQYKEGMFTPYIYQDKIYGFPETAGYTMIFYRTDTLAELGLTEPNTWDDVYKMLPVLQDNGMDFFYTFDVPSYTPFLFQYGGNFYNDAGTKSALDTPEAYSAYREYTNLFLNYKLQYKADFYQRFRDNSMPIGVGNYDMYVKLMTTAPELKGRWKMIPFVGHINSDGVVDRSTGGNISCTVIMKSTKHLDETWNFMKWYLGEDLQTEYANEVEATFGAGSRWSPANVETIKNMAYTDQEIQAILDQWEWYKEAPNVLGGYYTSRYLLTALNKTVLQNKNARTSLEDAVQAINKELERKQEEFHVTSVTTAE